MTTGGWIIMISTIIMATIFFGWCIFKILTTPGEAEHVHGFEIETPDEKEENDNE